MYVRMLCVHASERAVCVCVCVCVCVYVRKECVGGVCMNVICMQTKKKGKTGISWPAISCILSYPESTVVSSLCSYESCTFRQLKQTKADLVNLTVVTGLGVFARQRW